MTILRLLAFAVIDSSLFNTGKKIIGEAIRGLIIGSHFIFSAGFALDRHP